jgi:dolichyl-phosphate-mannose--protein O-mannosyl transferase
VHWPVFGFVVASIVAGALLVAGRLWRAVTAPIQRTATSVLYEQSTWGNEVRAWPSDRQPDSDARATPLWVALVTLTCGYLANLVPYELITRSKFLYHYTPALLIGILLAATCVDAAWAWAYALGAKRAAEHPNRRLAVAIGTALLALAAGAGFYYWGLPSVYGLKLTHEQAQARKWREGW